VVNMGGSPERVSIDKLAHLDVGRPVKLAQPPWRGCTPDLPTPLSEAPGPLACGQQAHMPLYRLTHPSFEGHGPFPCSSEPFWPGHSPALYVDSFFYFFPVMVNSGGTYYM